MSWHHRAFFIVCLVLLLLWAPSIDANHAPVGHDDTVSGQPIPGSPTDVAVVSEKLSIRIVDTKPTQGHFSWTTPTAHVTATYHLRNQAKKKQTLKLGFPVLSTPWLKSLPSKSTSTDSNDKPTPWFTVEVNGQPIKVKAQRVGIPTSWDKTNAQRMKTYSVKLRQWAGQDKKLMALLDEHARFHKTAKTYSVEHEQFEAAAKQHLINDHKTYLLLQFVTAKSDLNDLVELIPEIDPTLRHQNGDSYISFLSGYDRDKYKLFADQWKKQIHRWIEKRKDLANAARSITRVYDALKKRNAAFTKAVAYLQSDHKLNEPTAVQLIQHLTGQPVGSVNYAPLDAIAELFDELDKQLKAERAADTRYRAQWGADNRFISPFTGQLYDRRAGWTWPDDSVARLVGRKLESWKRGVNHVNGAVFFLQSFGKPMTLMRYELTIDPGADATVKVTYRHRLNFDQPLYSGMSYTIIPQLTYILKTVRHWKSFGPIDVSIEVPHDYHAIISPHPQKTTNVANGPRVHHMTLNNPKENLHVGLLGLRDSRLGSMQLSRLIKPTDLPDIETLLRKVKHPSVLPVLQLARVNCLSKVNRYEATNTYEAFKRDYGHIWIDPSGTQFPWGYTEAKKVRDWIDAKSKSPVIATRQDFELLKPRKDHDHSTLTRPERDRLLRDMTKLKTARLTGSQFLGRHFILAQCGHDREAQLKAMIAIGQAHPDRVIETLQLLGRIDCPKTMALAFVLKHCDLSGGIPLNASAPGGPKQIAARAALRSFHDNASAPRLIEAARQAKGHMIEATIEAVSRAAGPEQFDQLIALGEKAVDYGGSAMYRYLEGLQRIGKQRAIPILRGLAQTCPRAKGPITVKLAELGDRSVIADAVNTYNTSSDRKAVQHAGRILQILEDPKVFAQLNYRKGFKTWVNEQLLNVTRNKGGDEYAYRFVEAFYHEHVKGRRKQHFIDTCESFAMIGDTRAIPYLREILANTERKSDAANALGRLLLTQRLTQ